MIVYLDDGGATMHVYIGRVCLDPVSDAISYAVGEYYEDGEFVNGRIMKSDEKISVNFDGNVITHTVKEWNDIYEGVTNKPFAICQSEY